MSDSLSWYKEKLNELGLSTSTPGMVGEDRYEELRRRYEDHSRGYSNSTVKNADKNDQISPLISQLSITDLKGRLTALGEVWWHRINSNINLSFTHFSEL